MAPLAKKPHISICIFSSSPNHCQNTSEIPLILIIDDTDLIIIVFDIPNVVSHLKNLYKTVYVRLKTCQLKIC